jgi:hypothetical protein
MSGRWNHCVVQQHRRIDILEYSYGGNHSKSVIVLCGVAYSGFEDQVGRCSTVVSQARLL